MKESVEVVVVWVELRASSLSPTWDRLPTSHL